MNINRMDTNSVATITIETQVHLFIMLYHIAIAVNNALVLHLLYLQLFVSSSSSTKTQSSIASL